MTAPQLVSPVKVADIGDAGEPERKTSTGPGLTYPYFVPQTRMLT